jgi:DNA-binding MarR family transcriptional regulator
MALARIAAQPDISRADLARRLQVTPQAAGLTAAHLSERGLISRTKASPGLPVGYTLTAAGDEVLENAMPAIEEISQSMLRFFRPNLACALDGALRHIRIKLGED